jgi:hypothetical protein
MWMSSGERWDEQQTDRFKQWLSVVHPEIRVTDFDDDTMTFDVDVGVTPQHTANVLSEFDAFLDGDGTVEENDQPALEFDTRFHEVSTSL